MEFVLLPGCVWDYHPPHRCRDFCASFVITTILWYLVHLEKQVVVDSFGTMPTLFVWRTGVVAHVAAPTTLPVLDCPYSGCNVCRADVWGEGLLLLLLSCKTHSTKKTKTDCRLTIETISNLGRVVHLSGCDDQTLK